jgi:PAS domain S-box-containing protein
MDEAVYAEPGFALLDLRSLIEMIPGLAVCVRPDGSAEFANQAWHAYTGCLLEQLAGRDWRDALHPDDIGPFNAGWTATCGTQRPFAAEARMRRADGRYLRFMIRKAMAIPQAGLSAPPLRMFIACEEFEDRKQEESARQYSEQRHRLVLETASDAVVSMDQTGIIQAANPAIKRIFGYEPEEVIGRQLTVLMPEYMRDLHTNGFNRYLFTGRRHTNWQGTELTAQRKNGEEFPVEVSFGELNSAGHRLFTGFIRDISERKQAEIALHAAIDERTRLSAFREEIGMALSHPEELKGILHNCAGAMVRHLDAAFARIWTLSGDGGELELQASAGMYTRLDGPHSRIPVGQLKIGLIAQERKPHLTNDAQNDSRVSDKDWARREKMISFAGYPLILEDRLVGVMGMFSQKPLTESTLEALSFAAGFIAQGIERKRAEEALRRSEAFLAEGQRLGQIGSYSWRVATDEIRWSNELYRIYELEIGMPMTLEAIRTRVHPQDLSLYEKMLEKARNGGNDFEWQFRLLMPDQSIKYLHSVAHAARDHDGQLEYISVVQDVTERRQSQEALDKSRSELAQMSRLTTMGELAASIAHEVNQPLTAVTNNASACRRLLANRNLEPEVLRQALDEIIQDGTRASAVIARIRAFLKKKPVEPSEVNINEVIQETVALVGQELFQNHVRIEYQLTQPLLLVVADRVQMQQVLLNLIMNAIEAMAANDDQPRLIHIDSRIDESGDLLVAVRDSGTGLGSTAGNVFTPFFTTKANGMGMGLSISRSLIEGLGGRLWAGPNSPRGSVFSFTLPVASGGHS